MSPEDWVLPRATNPGKTNLDRFQSASRSPPLSEDGAWSFHGLEGECRGQGWSFRSMSYCEPNSSFPYALICPLSSKWAEAGTALAKSWLGRQNAQHIPLRSKKRVWDAHTSHIKTQSGHTHGVCSLAGIALISVSLTLRLKWKGPGCLHRSGIALWRKGGEERKAGENLSLHSARGPCQNRSSWKAEVEPVISIRFCNPNG